MAGIPKYAVGLLEGHPAGVAGTMSDVRRIVRDRLRGGVYRLSSKRAKRQNSRRSTVWEHFRMVEDERGAAVGYAGCLHCLDVLRHDPHMSGTSSLFSHLRSCTAITTAPVAPPSFAMPGMTEVTVKEEELEDEDPLLVEGNQQQEPDTPLLDACVDYLVSDLLPPQALHSASFLRLAQLLLECGAAARDCGTAQVRTLLPSQSLLAARVSARAADARQHLLAKVAEGKGWRGAALVLCEMPGQQQGPRGLLLRTLQDWRLHTHFLGLCRETAEEERQDPRAEVTAVLKKIKLTEAWEQAPPLLWKGAARLDDDVVPCASRMLERSVRHLLEAPQKPLPKVRECLNKCRSLVRWAATEDAELAERLTTDGGDASAWRRTLAMVKGVCTARDELQHTRDALGDDELTLIMQLEALLEPVRAAAVELEAPHAATLHKVVPWLLHLNNACQPQSTDGVAKAAMKAILREGLKQHATPTRLHNLAVFFYPRMSSLRVLEHEEQQQVRQAVLSMAGHATPPPAENGTKWNRHSGPLAYLEDVRPEELSVEREVEVYSVMRDDANPDDLLSWWCRNASLLPQLAAVAARVLATPASTVNSAAVTLALEDLSYKLLRNHHDDQVHEDDLALLHARLAGL